jgi:type II secretory pathway component PulF
MNTYRFQGVDKDTGEDVKLAVTAVSRAEAERAVQDDGYAVGDLIEVERHASDNSRKKQIDSGKKKIDYVFARGCLLLFLLSILGGLIFVVLLVYIRAQLGV